MSQEDEFYCGSEESDETQDRRQNALQEAIDRALRRTDHACGTEQNPHVSSMDANIVCGRDRFDDFEDKQCEKCGMDMFISGSTVKRITFESVDPPGSIDG